MILPCTIRLSKGSFATTIPKSMGLYLKLDELLNDENKTTRLIAEEIEAGVLIRRPTLEEQKRFDIQVP